MRVVATVPAHTIADGEYDEIAVGGLMAVGFTLQGAHQVAAEPVPGVVQDGAQVPVTRVTGTVLRPSDQVPAVLDAGVLHPLLASTDDAWSEGARITASGRLAVEPYLWAVDGTLWPLVPDGARLWSVVRIHRAVGAAGADLAALPGPPEVDQEALYLLTLERCGTG